MLQWTGQPSEKVLSLENKSSLVGWADTTYFYLFKLNGVKVKKN